jgi:hypothetical protein
VRRALLVPGHARRGGCLPLKEHVVTGYAVTGSGVVHDAQGALQTLKPNTAGLKEPPNKGMKLTRSAPATRIAALAAYLRR